MALEIASAKLIGILPIMLHNPQGADPLNPKVIELSEKTRKRSRTFEDEQEIAKLDFVLSCYYDPVIKWFLPSEMVEAAIIAAAKQIRKGKACNTMMATEALLPLHFEHEKLTPEQIRDQIGRPYVDRRGVVVSGRRIQKTRMLVPDPWHIEVSLQYDTNDLNTKDIKGLLEEAGRKFGLGTWRRKYGKFRVEDFQSRKVIP